MNTQKNHTINTMQNQPTTDVVLVDKDRGDDIVKEYVAQLENNIEYFKEQCAILQTQKELAQAKVRRLELQLFQCIQTHTL